MCRRWLLLCLVLVLVIGGTLTSCARDRVEPAPEVDAIATPVPTMSRPATPSERRPLLFSVPAKNESIEGFVRRYMSVSARIQNTGVTDPYESMIKYCMHCHAYLKRIQGIYRRGGSIRFEGARVRSIRVRFKQRGVWFVRFVQHAGKTKYRERKHGKLKSMPGGEVLLEASVIRVDGAWHLMRLVQIAT